MESAVTSRQLAVPLVSISVNDIRSGVRRSAYSRTIAGSCRHERLHVMHSSPPGSDRHSAIRSRPPRPAGQVVYPRQPPARQSAAGRQHDAQAPSWNASTRGANRIRKANGISAQRMGSGNGRGLALAAVAGPGALRTLLRASTSARQQFISDRQTDTAA